MIKTKTLVPLSNFIFTRPNIVSIISVATCWFISFVLSSPVYMTNDDVMMRAEIQGTVVHGMPPSPFAGHLSLILGKILINFYNIFPKYSWYDIFFYFFLSISIFSITRVLSEDISERGFIYKLAVVFLLPIIFSVSFLHLQFTVVSGVLVVSVIAVFVSFYRKKTITKKEYILKSLYIIFALISAALVRPYTALLLGFFGFLLLIPIISWRNIFGLIRFPAPVILGLLLSAGIIYVDQKQIKANPDWKYWLDFNDAYVNLVNDSLFSAMPSGLAFYQLGKEGLDFNETEKFIWSGGYYRLLVNWYFIGETEGAYSLANIQKVAAEYKDKVKISGNYTPKSFIYNFEWLSPYFVLFTMLALAFRNKRHLAYSLYIIICFNTFIFGLGFIFRELPYRLWINFVLLAFTVFVSYININYSEAFKSVLKQDTSLKFKYAANIFLISVLIISSFSLLSSQMQHNAKFLEEKKRVENALEQLDNRYIYCLEPVIMGYLSVPFGGYKLFDLKLKNILFAGSLQSPVYRRFYHEEYGLPNHDTLKSLIENKDIYILSIGRITECPLFVSYFMYEQYKLRTDIVDMTPESISINSPDFLVFKYKLTE